MVEEDYFNKKVDQEFSETRLDYWIKKKFPNLSYSILCKFIRKGNVRINGSRTINSRILKSDDVIKVPKYFIESNSVNIKEDYTRNLKKEFLSWIIFINDEFMIINKPSGIAVQGGTKVKRNIDDMLSIMVNKNNEKPKLVHRIDRDTSGLLIVSRSLASAKNITKQFKDRKVKKFYLALVYGKSKYINGVIDLPISYGGKRYDSKTYFKVLHEYMNFSLLLLNPHTGRKNQIRNHLYQLDIPIVGDKKFLPKTVIKDVILVSDKHLNLHAYKIGFCNQEGDFREFLAPIPNKMYQNLKKLHFDFSKLKKNYFSSKEKWSSITNV